MSTSPMPTRTKLSAAEIRRGFVDYFTSTLGHRFVPSSPVVPHDDPTLLFTNAGMNQFKDVLLGLREPEGPRTVNSQKCIRAGGKHNDLEDVGRDHYHHTFFEMLGNWSFGDYFKAEAIDWAWKLLTEVWGLKPERLHATYFEGAPDQGLAPDDEAREMWLKYLPPERVHPGNLKDNFWEMGETGPCGPCSEIHVDLTDDCSGGALVNADDGRVVELWNLVFIQFNRDANGALNALPAKHVDTGMGLERLARILQGKASNYDTDLFTPIFTAIEKESGARAYGGALDDAVDTAYRVIADHIRCLAIALADGARPGNEGRGYVLRRILRRAVRHAHQTLGVKKPLLCRLVPAVVETLGEAFGEMKAKAASVTGVIEQEESLFLKTLDRGLVLFEQALKRAGETTQISAADAFKLHDTFGFPIDLTRVMAEERGMTVDEQGFQDRMDSARAQSRSGGMAEQEIALTPSAIANLKEHGIEPTLDVDKYHGRPLTAKLVAVWNGTDFDHVLHVGKRVGLILNRTNFYSEAGGQVGDAGSILTDVFEAGNIPMRGFAGSEAKGDFEFHVDTTRNDGGYVLHIGRVTDGKVRVGERVNVTVDRKRREPTRANHTATHLLNFALRQVLGDEVEQRGSLVAPDRLRFDFSFNRALTPDELAGVEKLVNASIHADARVHAGEAPLASAEKINGVRAVFGERYPDPVRIVSIGAPIEKLVASPGNEAWLEFPIEFCGGTHLDSTGQAQRFAITQEQALAAGVRRITAITGPAALAADAAGKELESRAFRTGNLTGDELVAEFNEISSLMDELTVSLVARHRVMRRVKSVSDQVKAVRKRAEADRRDGVVDQARVIAETVQGRIIVDELLGADQDLLRSALDVMKAKRPEAAVLFLSDNDVEGKVSIAARVPDELIKQGLKAGDWVRAAAQACGGNGGGRPDMATAGGKDPDKSDEALEAARKFAEEALG